MINKGQKHHFIRTGLKEKQKTSKTKAKLFLLLLKRACYSKMKNYLQHILKVQQQESNTLNAAFTRVQRNIQFVKLISWRKIVHYAQIKNKENHIFKNALLFSSRFQKSLMGIGFRRISAFGSKKTIQANRNLEKSKPIFMKFILCRLHKKSLTQGFLNIRLFAHGKLSKIFKQALLCKSVQNIFVKRINYSWTRIISVTNSQHQDIEHQLGELNNQLVSLRREISRKDNQIEQLKSLNSQKKRQPIIFSKAGRRSNSSLQNSRKSIKSNGSRKQSSQDFSERRSHQGQSVENNMNNVSILSWLNGSFMSIKSGKSSLKSISGLECNCRYREKYNKYRAETSSLRNQMQIIKSQLEVTKELNEHLQEEISNLCGGETESLQLQMLKKQVKELRKQKQIMRDKMLKSQKYIANLKYQFKLKIQNLYRNLKKSTHN